MAVVENPELIRRFDGPINSSDTRSKAPLFLIHDGGGTTFAYHCLNTLQRTTYGLFNPRYHTGGSFEGGVRGMARLYGSMIKRTCAEPQFIDKRNSEGRLEIIIGGWSMGGLLSVEIAKVLLGDRDVQVIGVLMMDSMCPSGLPQQGGHLETLDHLDLGKTANRTFALSIQAMQEALRVIKEWQPPVWADDEIMQRPLFSQLRAAEFLPLGKRRHVIDIYRNDPALGWDKYDSDLFIETVQVAGNHFSMFSFEHVAEISKAMIRCCDTLERLGRSSRL